MAQQLRVHAALSEHPSLVSVTHTVAQQLSRASVLEDPTPGLAGTRHVVDRHTCRQNTLTHKIKIKINKQTVKMIPRFSMVEMKFCIGCHKCLSN